MSRVRQLARHQSELHYQLELQTINRPLLGPSPGWKHLLALVGALSVIVKTSPINRLQLYYQPISGYDPRSSKWPVTSQGPGLGSLPVCLKTVWISTKSRLLTPTYCHFSKDHSYSGWHSSSYSLHTHKIIYKRRYQTRFHFQANA